MRFVTWCSILCIFCSGKSFHVMCILSFRIMCLYALLCDGNLS